MTVTQKYGLIFDPLKCTGCRECEKACVDAHPDDIVKEPRIKIKSGSAGSFKATYCVQCNECAPSAVCPSDLITFDKARFTWLLEEERCIACNACIPKCPFNAIFLDPTMGVETAYKCDMCIGVAGGPKCVSACPTSAIAFGIAPLEKVREGAVT